MNNDPYYAHAIDVSHYQVPRLISYDQAPGVRLVIANLSDGTKPDPRAVEHIARARDAGKLVAGYHYVWSDPTAVQQLDTLNDVLAKVGPLDLPVTLDVEVNESDPDVKSLRRRGECARMMALELGGYTLVYSYPATVIRAGDSMAWARRYPQWLAHYTGTPGHFRPPAGWSNVVAHQYAVAPVDWYAGGQPSRKMDLNVYDPLRVPWLRPEEVLTGEELDARDRLKVG